MPTLEQIASELVLLSPDDSASRLHLEKMLRDLAQSGDAPEAVRELAWQAIVLVQGLLQAKDPDANLRKLSALLDQMIAAEAESGGGNGATASASSSSSGSVIDDGLVAEFLSKQESTLTDFEADCLALENGDTSRFPALKRQIHTWKGEAGLLGFHDLSSAMHGIEEALGELKNPDPAAVSDTLLELKDRLGEYFTARRAGAEFSLDVSATLAALNAIPSVAAVASVPEPVCVAESSPPEETPAAPSVAGRIFEMPAEIDMDLVQEFRSESVEHFQQAELALMALENDPADSESVNTVFRAFHTVKGVAGFVGVSYITELAHKAETFFDRFRKGTLTMRGTHTDLAFEAVDMLKHLLGTLNEAISSGRYEVTPAYERLIHRLEHPEALDGGSRGGGIREKVGEILLREGKISPIDVDTALAKQQEGDSRPVGEILVEQQAAKPVDVAHALRSQQPAGRDHEPEGTVKVYTSRLDNLINMVGELVIAQSMVSQDPLIQKATNQRLVRNVAQLNKITRSLQELSLSMRMVSVKSTFQKMARLVRDLARKAHKEIAFITEGEETELDRNMVEAIADPLVHMVRNAADHGIESPDEREQAGKPRQGRILLRAAHEGGSVIITLSDDGRGLNKQKILVKAVERELVEPGAQLTDAEIHKLLFMPGFSTADKVTDVSGRGVGMDVVRTNIEALRGTVEIHSQENAGSVFSVRLPLTLAIIDGMVVRVGFDRFILPTIAITETFRAEEKDVSTVHGQAELVMLRGDLIPVARLHRLFDIQDGVASLTEGILVVTESKGRRIALLVDELLGQQQVVIKSLGTIFGRVQGVSGGAIMGDGQVSLILDTEGLIQLSTN
ncbi:Hpt domain-containing protein [bacterium]|nr:Hpt domain-containing protein [bacterium]MBU1984353.1 Hpt domain-containing protein [bacterium]